MKSDSHILCRSFVAWKSLLRNREILTKIQENPMTSNQDVNLRKQTFGERRYGAGSGITLRCNESPRAARTSGSVRYVGANYTRSCFY